MIVSREMKHAVENQNLDFLRRRMAQPACVLFRDLRRNRDIARQSADKVRIRRKRKHIRGLIFPSKTTVKCA